jgi:sugar lactone lactonase YvrE
VIRQFDFNGVVSAKDALNDLRIDTVHDYAYLTNAGNKGSLVVLDLKTGKARQVLVGDRSTFADPDQHLMIGKEVALRPDGSVVAIHADGIALSPDAQWLYYRPLTDHNYWRVPTGLARHAALRRRACQKSRVSRHLRAERRADHGFRGHAVWRRSRTSHRGGDDDDAG